MNDRHDRGQRLNAGGGGGDDLDPAGGDALDGVDGGPGGVQAAQDPPGRRDEMITGVGGDDAAADAVEQRHPEFAFESGDRLGQRWLGDLQVVGGPAEAAVVDDRDEVLQLPGVHGALLVDGVPGGQPVASDGDGARIGHCAPGDGGLGEWDGPAEVFQQPPGQGRVAGGVAVGVVGDGMHGLDAHLGRRRG